MNHPAQPFDETKFRLPPAEELDRNAVFLETLIYNPSGNTNKRTLALLCSPRCNLRAVRCPIPNKGLGLLPSEQAVSLGFLKILGTLCNFGTSSLYEGRAPYFLKLPCRLASTGARERVLRQNEAWKIPDLMLLPNPSVRSALKGVGT